MKAAIIGGALRTPLGSSIANVTEAVLAGARPARANHRFDTTTYVCPLGMEVTEPPGPAPRTLRYLRRMGLLGHAVAMEAAARTAVPQGPRLGVFTGYGGLRAHWNDMMPALANQAADGRALWERGLRKLHPFWMLQHLSNNAHALAAKSLDARGEGSTFGGSNGGAQALASATAALCDGVIDRAIVFAYDSLLDPEVLIDLASDGLAASGRTIAPAPYSVGARGFIPSEGAAALVLARPSDAPHSPTISTQTFADGGPRLPKLEPFLPAALAQSHQGQPIDGCGVATHAFDGVERCAIAEVRTDPVQLTALSASLGQMGAADLLIRTLVMAECLRLGALPPIAGLEEPAPGPLHPVRQRAKTNAAGATLLAAMTPGLLASVEVSL